MSKLELHIPTHAERPHEPSFVSPPSVDATTMRANLDKMMLRKAGCLPARILEEDGA